MRPRALTLSLLLVTLAGASISSAQGKEPQETVWAWEHREAALEAVFPHPTREADFNAEGPEWIISVRVSPAWEKPEWQLIVKKGFHGLVSATIVESKGSSVAEQLATLRAAHPEWTDAQCFAAVETTERTVTGKSCHVLTSLADKASHLHVGLVNRSFMCMHCSHFDFLINTYYGEPMTFSMDEPNGSYWGWLPDHPHKLLKWVGKVRKAIDECESGSHG